MQLFIVTINMCMPRLSLYRPEKGNDYKFIDKTAWEMFQVGGTDVLVHKYIGPGDKLTENIRHQYRITNQAHQGLKHVFKICYF